MSLDEFRRVRSEFETKVRRYAPRSIAFLGMRALLAMIGDPDIAWGRQALDVGGAMAWVLPNPSRRNRRFTLDSLVGSYAQFRLELTRRAT